MERRGLLALSWLPLFTVAPRVSAGSREGGGEGEPGQDPLPTLSPASQVWNGIVPGAPVGAWRGGSLSCWALKVRMMMVVTSAGSRSGIFEAPLDDEKKISLRSQS